MSRRELLVAAYAAGTRPVTVKQLAARAGLTWDQTRACLRELVRQGHASQEMGEDGTRRYRIDIRKARQGIQKAHRAPLPESACLRPNRDHPPPTEAAIALGDLDRAWIGHAPAPEDTPERCTWLFAVR